MSVSTLRLGRAGALTLVLALLLALALSGCGGSLTPEASFTGDFLPFSISIGTNGNSTIEGNVSYTNDIGTFSIGAKYELPQQNSDSLYVILRDRHTGFDKVYEVQTEGTQFNAIVNGTTSITVTKDQVLIDITSGSIRKITFERVHNSIAEGSGSSNWWQRTVGTRWDAGWAQSWYKPYDLAKWAYDDSTIEKWYGAGFVWFLLRLVLSLFLALVDTILTAGFLVGQVAFIIFGPTGRDVVYGLMVLFVVVCAIAGMASS